MVAVAHIHMLPHMEQEVALQCTRAIDLLLVAYP